ncbi:MAG: hypothetical protein M1814_001903 [Vezdaea aestivalis]|nr:MAG: hypothetical protein M1814_001903 [Vezdaea aestivalis]
MEVVGGTASAITIAALAARVSELCFDYIKVVRDDGQGIRRLLREVDNLKDFHDSVERAVGHSTNTNLTLTKKQLDANGALFECAQVLRQVEKKLENSIKWKVKWPFRKKEVCELFDEIQRHKLTLALSLGIDNASGGPNKEPNQLVLSLASKTPEDIWDKTLKWITMIDPISNQKEALRKRESGTGLWFFESAQYRKWLTDPNSFLCLYGAMGCGKTTVCGMAIDEEQTKVCAATGSAIRAAVVYFYFDFNDPKKQNADDFLRSLIKQLCFLSKSLPQPLVDSYKNYFESRRDPGIDDLHNILQAAIASFDDVFIFVDALDECPLEGNLRRGVLQAIRSIHAQQSQNLHFLVTSRKQLDIENSLSLLQCMTTEQAMDIRTTDVDKDIGRYVENRLRDEFDHWHESDRKSAIETIPKRANGMFRWAALQLDVLQPLQLRKQITQALDSLPRTLDQTYSRILKQVVPEQASQVLATLRLLAFSARPLHLQELAEAAVLDTEEDEPFALINGFSKPSEVLRPLQGLVKVINYTEPSGVRQTAVQLAHFSVKEYLVSEQISSSPQSNFRLVSRDAHSILAHVCLLSLMRQTQVFALDMHLSLETADSSEDHHMLPRLHKGFSDYARAYWGCHFEQGDPTYLRRIHTSYANSRIERTEDEDQLSDNEWHRAVLHYDSFDLLLSRSESIASAWMRDMNTPWSHIKLNQPRFTNLLVASWKSSYKLDEDNFIQNAVKMPS